MASFRTGRASWWQTSLLLAGLRLVTEGFSRFYALRRWVPLWVDVALILAAGIVLAAWSEGSANPRVAVVGVVSAFFLVRTGLEPLSDGEARRSFAQRLVTTLNLTSAVFALLRAAWALLAPPYASLLREGGTLLLPGVIFMAVNLTSMNVALYLTFARLRTRAERGAGEREAARRPVADLLALPQDPERSGLLAKAGTLHQRSLGGTVQSRHLSGVLHGEISGQGQARRVVRRAPLCPSRADHPRRLRSLPLAARRPAIIRRATAASHSPTGMGAAAAIRDTTSSVLWNTSGSVATAARKQHAPQHHGQRRPVDVPFDANLLCAGPS